MRVAIDYRHHIRADGGRCQVEHSFARLQRHFAMALVSTGRSRIKYELNIVPDRELNKPINALMGGRDFETFRPGQPIGFRINANHSPHLKMRAVAHYLDHKVGADITGTNDRAFMFFNRHLSISNP